MVGVLRRSAEGNIKHIFAVIGISLIAVLWLSVYKLVIKEEWLHGEAVFLPDKLGWLVGVTIILAFLVLFYVFAVWIEHRNKIKDGAKQ